MIYAEAMRKRKASSNPARLVRLRRENNARIRFLSFEEEQFLRDGIAQWIEPVVLISLHRPNVWPSSPLSMASRTPKT
jgi:hypothetical protein